jgi:Ca2+-binding RTX toxin-like protein
VTVDLKLNLALAGGMATNVANINNVLGGSGNNILVGNGNNFLQGGSGRDILISGGGTSTLQAGGGEAVMIGAHYLFDTNLVALDRLMAEWSQTYSLNPFLDYRIRVNHLEFGGGLNGPFLLNAVTVIPQPGVTTLISGGGFDFLILDPGDILVKPPRPGEVVLFV